MLPVAFASKLKPLTDFVAVVPLMVQPVQLLLFSAQSASSTPFSASCTARDPWTERELSESSR